MELVPALRLYLTGCGFRLPGEAQKIDRFVEVFQKTYWQDNAYTSYCPFKSSDTVHIITYAIIMLNTDLHRANVDDKKYKKRKKMSKDEFINNLRGCDQGGNIDRDYLSRVYDDIAAHPIELEVESSEREVHGSSLTTTTAPKTSSSDALNDVNVADEKLFYKEIVRNVRDCEDLLRSLSPFTYPFQLTSIDTNISIELVAFMFETVWLHFHAITEALLTDVSFDLYITMPALDILCYAITSAILLNAKVERHAFAIQLKRLQYNCRNTNRSTHDLDNEDWFNRLDRYSPEQVIESVADMHRLFVLLKDSTQQSTNYEITRSVASKIEKRAKVLEKNTFFVREGELAKRNRSGRLDHYRFFLFSDYLYYCHQGMGGEYKVHEELDVQQLGISDIDEPTGCSFYITHPTKSFIVIADSIHSKLLWYKDIKQTIESCLKRIDNRNRRLSMVDRIVLQKTNQDLEAQKRNFFSRKNLFRSTSVKIGTTLISSPPPEGSPRATTISRLNPLFHHSGASSSDVRPGERKRSNSKTPSMYPEPLGSPSGKSHSSESPLITQNITYSPTPEEKATILKESQNRFQQRLETLDSKSLASLYAAVYFILITNTFYINNFILLIHLSISQYARDQTFSKD
jgi:brefeldin A-inhibited guanine nucleotide-exchange protein